MKKTCFKCNKEKNLDEFYVHKKMKDGHLNKCIECAKKDVLKHRKLNTDKIQQCDRERAKLPHRRLLNKKISKRYRERYPNRKKAHYYVNNAIRDGRLKRETHCSICGCECNAVAHHKSYAKENWFNITWVCEYCHMHVCHKNTWGKTEHKREFERKL